jgi:hypothetical protein
MVVEERVVTEYGVSMVVEERAVVGVTMEEDVAVDSGEDAGPAFISLAYDSSERL